MMDTSGTTPPEEDVVRWVDSQKGTVLRRDRKALVQKRLDQKGPVRGQQQHAIINLHI